MSSGEVNEIVGATLKKLKKLKRDGVTRVKVSPESLERLGGIIKKAEEPIRQAAPAQTKIQKTPEEALVKVTTEPAAAAKKPVRSHLLPEPPAVNLPEGDKSERWNYLEELVLNCSECNSHVKPGKKVVFGVGNLDADIFFCGEAPGAEEEIQGEPFVGPAGELLTKVIQAMGLSREKVYIGNIMNWRPETDQPYGNRPPTEEEMNFCLPYLRAQLDVVKPRVIVALGATAVNGLLGYDRKRSITKNRGQWHEFNSIPTIITFHPSYVLRNGTMVVKRQIWEDMLSVMEAVELPISEKQRGFFR